MKNIMLSRKAIFLSPAILFICLIKLTKSTSVTIADLKCVCDIRNGSSDEVKINRLPSYCTAAATSQNSEGDVKKMASLKTNTPFIMYFNGFNYSEWGQMGFTFDKKFTTYMKDHKIDGIIFDYMYHASTYYDVARNQAVLEFFKKLKQSNPKGLFGLALPKDADVLPFAFDYSYLNSAVDFYVIQTINYRTCEHNTIMKRTCTIGDMRKSLTALSQTMDMSKVLLTVQVYSIGVLSGDHDVPTLISYSDMCHYKGKELSRHRKYCKDSLRSLWKKGALVPEFGMLGVYIQFIDYDDFAGKCGCETANNNKQFPATAAIVSGMNKDNSERPKSCSDFGDYDSTSSSSEE